MAQSPNERRAVERVPVRAPGRIFYGSQLALWADCEIRDRSDLGVQVSLSNLFNLPERVVLADLQLGMACEVLVKWRRRDMAGLWFEARYDLQGEIPERLYGVRSTWMALRSSAGAHSE